MKLAEWKEKRTVLRAVIAGFFFIYYCARAHVIVIITQQSIEASAYSMHSTQPEEDDEGSFLFHSELLLSISRLQSRHIVYKKHRLQSASLLVLDALQTTL